MTSYRLPNRGRVDHGKPVRFTFDGKSYQGLAGDTLASALLANGVHLMGRSFKYHRPRGVVSAGSDEPNALMGTRRGPGRFEPNTRATIQELRDGLEATSQNRWPSLAFDVGAINDRLGSLFSAGFYYKTFMWPRAFWDRVYEPIIRNAAGLGVSPTEPDADRYASRFAHTDVLDRRRRPRRPRRRARRRPLRRVRHARRRDRRARRLAALRARRRHRRQARLGLARRRPSPSSPRSRTSR